MNDELFVKTILKYQDHYKTLLTAAEHGHAEIVEKLIDENVDLNTTDQEGNTALIWASRKNHINITANRIRFKHTKTTKKKQTYK